MTKPATGRDTEAVAGRDAEADTAILVHRVAPYEEDFRREVVAFLRAAVPPKGIAVETGGGSTLTRAVGYQRKLFDAGLAGITWPAEYGGRSLPGRYQHIYDEEANAFQVPPRSLEIGLGMAGPTLLVHASEEQKRTFIPPLLRGDHVWCELFSEPGAGSDLSSVQTRARRDGDEFVLEGQKVWTSAAQYSDYAACLARSDPDRPKREGITMFLVDMHTPGITVRPLRQITGEAQFNEVFLDGVRVPVVNVLGELHGGWRVARTMLAFERQALGAMGSGGGGRGGFAALVDEAARRGVADRPEMRERLAQLRVRQMVLRYLGGYLQAKARSKRGKGNGGGSSGSSGSSGSGGEGGSASLLKLAMAQLVQETGLVAVEIAGMHAVAWEPDDPDGGRWANQLLNSRSASLGGGTNEIVRNVIAERVLGLPRDEEGDLMPGDLDRKPVGGPVKRKRQGAEPGAGPMGAVHGP
jgi:alkylation response protein AidB-like acyl-CoA dehydrogenase